MTMWPAYIVFLVVGWLVIGGFVISLFTHRTKKCPDNLFVIFIAMFFWPGVLATIGWEMEK